MGNLIPALITFIIVFGIIVSVHEYGHLFFAKRAGILVREYAVGMGPKIFAHRAKDGTLYTIRIVPVGGYVRMAGWADDTTEIKKGTPVSLAVVDGKVSRVNLSERVNIDGGVPMLVTEYEFEKALFIEGEVFGEVKRFPVEHDATIIEEDGTELRIAPLDVQYQSATIIGKILTNFAGPLNNFILGILAFILLTFLQGGVPSNSNQIGSIQPNSPAAQINLKAGDKIEAIDGHKTSNWNEVVNRISASGGEGMKIEVKRNGQTYTMSPLKPEKVDGAYRIGIVNKMNSGIGDMLAGGFIQAVNAATTIFRALGSLISHPNLNKLGGPVAIFQMSGQAAQGGIVTIVYFLAMLSINLGIVNLIPIPVLDGGKIVLNLIEAVRGKPLSQEKEGVLTLIGVAFMVLLMIAVTWNDIMRWIGH